MSLVRYFFSVRQAGKNPLTNFYFFEWCFTLDYNCKPSDKYLNIKKDMFTEKTQNQTQTIVFYGSVHLTIGGFSLFVLELKPLSM